MAGEAGVAFPRRQKAFDERTCYRDRNGFVNQIHSFERLRVE